MVGPRVAEVSLGVEIVGDETGGGTGVGGRGAAATGVGGSLGGKDEVVGPCGRPESAESTREGGATPVSGTSDCGLSVVGRAAVSLGVEIVEDETGGDTGVEGAGAAAAGPLGDEVVGRCGDPELAGAITESTREGGATAVCGAAGCGLAVVGPAAVSRGVEIVGDETGGVGGSLGGKAAAGGRASDVSGSRATWTAGLWRLFRSTIAHGITMATSPATTSANLTSGVCNRKTLNQAFHV